MNAKASVRARYLPFAVAIGVLAAVILLPLPERVLSGGSASLTLAGRQSLGVLLFCLVLWITEPVPFHITGLIGMIILAFMGVDSFGGIVKSGFGSDIVVFFIGVLVLSAFITRSGLGKRIAMLILTVTGNRTSWVLLGFLTAGALVSMWVTALAGAAIFTPLAKALLEEEGVCPGKSNFGKALMISCAWGPIIGGVATPAGAGPNPLAINFLQELAGIDLGFLEWMRYGLPISLLMLLPGWAILMLSFRPEMPFLNKSRAQIREELAAMPGLSRDQRSTLIIFAVTVLLWLTSRPLGQLIGIGIPTSLPAIIGCCLFFLPGVTSLSWKQIRADISWEGILLIATGISMGMCVYRSGAADWLASTCLGGLSGMGEFARILTIIVFIAIIKIGLSSNTVTATVIMPLIIALAQSFQLPVLSVAIPASMTLSVTFILVTSSPTSVIPYNEGYFSVGEMARAGSVMTVAASLISAVTIFLIGW